MRSWARRSAVLTIAGIAVAAAGCGSSSAEPTVPHARPSPPYRYVAVGGTDAAGRATADPLLDAWPQLLFRSSMPLSAVLVNAAVPQETVAEATIDQVPTTLAQSPTVVTVWLVSGDLLAGTSPATYASGLNTLLTDLRNGGSTTVLVGNSPPSSLVPGVVACEANAHPRGLTCPATTPNSATLDAAVTAYNAAIAAAAAATGAVVVDLHTALSASAQSGSSVLNSSGSDLSTAGSALVAQTFGAALRGTSAAS